jgi:hypothetical protein
MLIGSDQKNAMNIIIRLLIIEPINATHAGANRNKPVLTKTPLLAGSELYGLIKLRTSHSAIAPNDENMPIYVQYFTFPPPYQNYIITHQYCTILWNYPVR